MKFKALRDFVYHGESYSDGDIVDLIDHVAKKLCNRGYGEIPIETPEPEKEESKFSFKKKKRKNRSHSSG